MSKSRNTTKNAAEIVISIISARSSDFYSNDSKKLGISNTKLIKFEFEIDFQARIGINESDEKVIIEINIDAYPEKRKKEKGLFGIKGEFEFQLSSIDSIKNKKSKTAEPPREFVKKLLNISIGGIRGMLLERLNETEYNGFVLPLANVQKMMAS